MRLAHLAVMLGLALTMSACAQDSGRSFSDRLAGQRVHGDSERVVVDGLNRVDALPLAIGHCAHFHKSAQYAHPEGDGVVFHCVAS